MEERSPSDVLLALAQTPWAMDPADSASGRWQRGVCRSAGLAVELAQLEEPVELTAEVLAGRGTGAERDVRVARFEVDHATATAGNNESAERRLLAEVVRGGAAGIEKSGRRIQLSQARGAAAPAARAVSDQLNASSTTCSAPSPAPAARPCGPARAPRPR
ncbi:hypothetical protein GCM10023328_47450 [Modestobacter marinus]|uniref:Uncharacterized protein n=1 Tax=Modestobacter marinus TaxID=477641 RepID=A0ABQ2GAL9_9ACTN|nr:hypothetical protein GCM10011589_44950 [Modestobacter marinus]